LASTERGITVQPMTMLAPADRPYVAIHVAQSLDGRIALSGGLRTILSSPEGLMLAHRARAGNDAVLVGSQTVRADDPRLTVRDCEGEQPRRVVLASTLDVSPAARLFESGPGVLLIAVEGRARTDAIVRLEAAGAEIRLVSAGPDGLVSLPAALHAIRQWGVQRLLVEGGARVLTSFLRSRLVDEATIEIAPRLFGAPGLVAVGDIAVDRVEASPGLTDVTVERAGQSVVVRGRFAAS
jgi:5-amino-6-(5-phosphoribosylamino)uracil reductase/diaminohydroxyphosphoribosylaminopyrimidine deaminase/5-amino-6-(5-phosphoribosylamino)uracil reductase